MKNLIVIVVAVLVSMFILAGFTTTPREAGQCNQVGLFDFVPDEAIERENVVAALSMTREEVLLELRVLYREWRNEEQWGAFIESARLSFRDSQLDLFESWNEAYSLASSGLWVNTNMIGTGVRERLRSDKASTTSLQMDLAALQTMLPIVREARIQLTRSIMIEMFENEDKGLFLEAWDELDLLEDQD